MELLSRKIFALARKAPTEPLRTVTPSMTVWFAASGSTSSAHVVVSYK